MKVLKKAALCLAGIALMLTVLVFGVMANEGYPTLAGVRNIIWRDGQIRIELPCGYRISEVHFEGDDSYSMTIADNIATIRVGYTHASIDVFFSSGKKNEMVHFGTVAKTNNWNRLVFHAQADARGCLSFTIDENGVSRDPAYYHIEQTPAEERALDYLINSLLIARNQGQVKSSTGEIYWPKILGEKPKGIVPDDWSNTHVILRFPQDKVSDFLAENGFSKDVMPELPDAPASLKRLFDEAHPSYSTMFHLPRLGAISIFASIAVNDTGVAEVDLFITQFTSFFVRPAFEEMKQE